MRRWLFLGWCVASLALAGAVSFSAQGINGTIETLPAIACHFETTMAVSGSPDKKQVREWYMWRQPSQIETRELADDTGEIWRLGRGDQVSYQRVFHKDKRVVEYSTGDLRALNRYPNWRRLASVIDPSLLKNKLKLTGKSEALGQEALRYQGQLGGVEFEVWWLEREQIPALVRQVYPDREVVLRLKAVSPLSKSAWPREQVDGYASIDYSDLGDKQSDPFVRRIQH